MISFFEYDMIGEIALPIENGADAVDIGKTIYSQPALGESIGIAVEVAHGSCTDLPPAKKLTCFKVNCAWPAFARERLRKSASELVYRYAISKASRFLTSAAVRRT